LGAANGDCASIANLIGGDLDSLFNGSGVRQAWLLLRPDGRKKARTLDALNAKATTQATAKPADLREAYTASAQASGLSAQSSCQVAHGMDGAAEATRRSAAAQSAFNDLLGARTASSGGYSRRAAKIAGFGHEMDPLQGKLQPAGSLQRMPTKTSRPIAIAGIRPEMTPSKGPYSQTW
jgi:hypothetical protein